LRKHKLQFRYVLNLLILTFNFTHFVYPMWFQWDIVIIHHEPM
jgi:hypothetical protein